MGMNANTSFNRPIVNPQFRANENMSKPVETEDKKGLSKGAKWAIGLGLTALAAGGIYLATKGKVKPSTNPTKKEIIENGEKFFIEENSMFTSYKDINGKLRKKELKGKDGSIYAINKYSKDTGYLIEHKEVGPNRREFFFDGSEFVEDIPSEMVSNEKSILKSVWYDDDSIHSINTFWPGTGVKRKSIIYNSGKVQSYFKFDKNGSKQFSACRLDVNDPLVAYLPDGKGGSIQRVLPRDKF